MNGEGKASTSKAAGPKTKPSNFCVQLHSILEHPRDPENLRWVDGEVDKFQITVDEQKGLEALRPNLDFKSMSSFVRQLSYYDFKRLSDRRKSNERRGEARVIVFTHHSGLFTRGNPANVEKMKRKLRIRAERGRRASAVSTGSVDDDHSQTQSQSGSPLFSPVGSGWPPTEHPPPVPSPSYPVVFGTGIDSFSLSAPPPARTKGETSGAADTQSQTRWQPYNPSEGGLAYLPPSAAPSPPVHEGSRFAPYSRPPFFGGEHRASIVSLASEVSPRSKSVEPAYYAGTSAHPSPSANDAAADYGGGGGGGGAGHVATSFTDPFATQPFPSPSAQPSQYFPSSRHPASPSAANVPPPAMPTGLPVAYDNSPSQVPPRPVHTSAYPTISSLHQYRPSQPSSYYFPNQPSTQQYCPDPTSQPHSDARNHYRFSSAPSGQPPYPYPQFVHRPDEYHSPTSVPDDDLNRRAALEARRTSYPFPLAPTPAPVPQSGVSERLPTQYTDTHGLSTTLQDAADWTTSKVAFETPVVGAASSFDIGPNPGSAMSWEQHDRHHFGRAAEGSEIGGAAPYHHNQAYYGSYPAQGGREGGDHDGQRSRYEHSADQ